MPVNAVLGWTASLTDGRWAAQRNGQSVHMQQQLMTTVWAGKQGNKQANAEIPRAGDY